MKKILMALLLLGCFNLKAQFTEPKFGKVEMADLEMMKYEKDTSAPALMLFNFGNSYFVLNSKLEFQFNYERHCQIKIFKKSAFDFADFKIQLYKNSQNKETISNLKAFTYNLVNGKITKTKLENDKIYRTDEDKYSLLSFALPDVKEGSVIEVAYTITSDFLYNFRGWNFQYRIPARWSQYSYRIPEYFDYRESTKGYFNFEVNKREKGSVTYNIPTQQVSSNAYTASVRSGGSQAITATTLNTTLAIKDVPAFVSEPNIDCEENYIQSIEFELSSIAFPGEMPKNYAQSWESVNKQMIEDDNFGNVLKATGFIKDTVQFLCYNRNSELEKATSIFNYVQSEMKWNDKYSLWSMNGLKKAYEDKVGNSAEINLLLTLMLRVAGLKADPVIFSTRDNGIAIAFYPTITKFNSVLACVKISGKTYLLDAVNKYCPFGTLPPNDVNGQGRLIASGAGEWVDLNSSGRYILVKNYVLQISPDGKFTGYIKGDYDGYAGLLYRVNLNSEKSPEDYVLKLQENMKGLTINNHVITGRDNNYGHVCDSFAVEITEHSECIGNKIMFNPLLYERIEKNRYTLEDRKYPVNYNYPYAENYRFTFILPAGYKVESLPKPHSLKLDDNSITFTYKVENDGDKLNISFQRSINKTIFTPEQYKSLKELYDKLVMLHAEQVILTKAS